MYTALCNTFKEGQMKTRSETTKNQKWVKLATS